jgi:hypothetical protein
MNLRCPQTLQLQSSILQFVSLSTLEKRRHQEQDGNVQLWIEGFLYTMEPNAQGQLAN